MYLSKFQSQGYCSTYIFIRRDILLQAHKHERKFTDPDPWETSASRSTRISWIVLRYTHHYGPGNRDVHSNIDDHRVHLHGLAHCGVEETRNCDDKYIRSYNLIIWKVRSFRRHLSHEFVNKKYKPFTSGRAPGSRFVIRSTELLLSSQMTQLLFRNKSDSRLRLQKYCHISNLLFKVHIDLIQIWAA